MASEPDDEDGPRPADLPVFCKEDGERVDEGAWVRLRRPSERFLPQPPADREFDLAGKIIAEKAEGGRISRRRRTIQTDEVQYVDAWGDRIVRPGRQIEAVAPYRWLAEDLPAAKAAADRILSNVGLGGEFDRYWLHFDTVKNTWWALGDLEYTGAVQNPPEISLEDNIFPRGFFRSLDELDGKVEWACVVVGHVRRLRRLKEETSAKVRPLKQLPEWRSLTEAARREGQSTLALAEINALVRGASDSAAADLYREAFEAGERFGFLAAADLVRRSEKARNGVKPKVAQKLAALDKIIVDELATGQRLRPYVLAATLLAEMDRASVSERARKLMKAGNPSRDRVALGRLIADRLKVLAPPD